MNHTLEQRRKGGKTVVGMGGKVEKSKRQHEKDVVSYKSNTLKDSTSGFTSRYFYIYQLKKS